MPAADQVRRDRVSATSRQPLTTTWTSPARGDSRPLSLLAVALVFVLTTPARAIDAFEQPPISYSDSTPANAVSSLQQRLARGDLRLVFDESTGYLKSVLDALRIPVSSQTLVFSKTSLQQRHITPRNPRAIYFNDDVYVGFVRGGDVLEISVADPALGTVFYVLEQHASEQPAFVRQTHECLLCHGGSQTRGVPGHIVRSVYPDKTGQPIFSAGSHRVDDTTLLADRWGGWYVSGRHGDTTHLGNISYAQRPEGPRAGDTSGLNQIDLSGRFDSAGYLSPHSDLVALSVLVHQASAHTMLARVSFDTRIALHREAALNRELGEPAGQRWPSTNTILDSAASSLVECFLFRGEPPLTAPLEGTTTFARDFAAAGPVDPRGRSLRALDLRTRLFRYPCSFLIGSQSFAALPEELRQRFWAKLDGVLTRGEGGAAFVHLTPADRTAIREILLASIPGVPPDWADR